MKAIIIRMAICFAFYILGAYATTDILRLLKGSTVAVNAPDCYCPVCHTKIALRDQLPIISYFKNHGSCRNCKSSIPISDLFLEIFLFLTMTLLSILLNFNWLAFALCIAVYEITKIIFLCRLGRRESAFIKNLMISLATNIALFALLAFLFALAQIG